LPRKPSLFDSRNAVTSKKRFFAAGLAFQADWVSRSMTHDPNAFGFVDCVGQSRPRYGAINDNSSGFGAAMDTGESGKFRRFTCESISERGENLDLSWLRNANQEWVDLPEPDILAQTAQAELESALEEIKNILRELSKA
jgi:hypothetical protein